MATSICYKVLVFALICSSQAYDVSRKKKPYYGSGILYYLTFIAIKVKIAILVGMAITAFIFFGKMFALIKYSTLLFKKDCDKREIVVDKPLYYDHHSSEPEVVFDHPGGHDYGPYVDYRSYTREQYNSQDKSESRSISNKIIENVNYIKDMIKEIDLTDLAFNHMNITKEACKRKFVCQIDEKAKRNTIIGLGLYMFSDMGLEKYRTASTKALEDCSTIYKDCEKNYGK